MAKYSFLRFYPVTIEALGNRHSALRCGIQKTSYTTCHDYLHTPDSASECGMTITECLN